MNHRQNFISSLEQRLESIKNQLNGNKFLTSMVRDHLEQESIDIVESLKKYNK